MNDSILDIISKILVPCALFFLGIIFNWMREDIKEIKNTLCDMSKSFLTHTSDHVVHCKHICERKK